MTAAQEAVIEACEEIVRRYSRDKTLYPETRDAILAADDPAAYGREFARNFGVGPLRTNGATCGRCGDRISSLHRHDFRTCSCGGVSVDGGTWYARRVYQTGIDFDSWSSCWPWTRIGENGRIE